MRLDKSAVIQLRRGRMIRGMLYGAVVGCLRHWWIRIASLGQEFELGTLKICHTRRCCAHLSVILETCLAAFCMNTILGLYFDVGLRTIEILPRMFAHTIQDPGNVLNKRHSCLY
jgi:hypothetical protein